jgi:Domain of unknown function (DUF4386)
MNLRPIEPSQQTAARVAGLLYLLTNITAMFGFYARVHPIVSGDAAQTARNILASERLFRIGVVMELITVAGVLILIVALYSILKDINPTLALVALSWRLVEDAVLTVITLTEFAVLVLLSGADFLRAVDAHQLQSLAYACLRVDGAGFNVGFAFLGLGSTVFSYLWFKSRYIPRAIAVLGMFASSVMAVVSLAILVFPGLSALGLTYMAPMGIYEFTLGFWLLIKGIRQVPA